MSIPASEKIRIGVVGLGARGVGMAEMIANLDGVTVPIVCDYYTDRVSAIQDKIQEQHGYRPEGTTEWHDLLNKKKVDAIIIVTSWETHIPIAIASMEAGIPVATEVGGSYSLESCWDLVHTQEKTGTPFMLLENCCYGREEMMVLHMVREGLFGDVVQCDGGYQHHLAEEILKGEENRHYRLRNYLHRNGENYPTHELGPIAKILNINRGNRFLSLVSMSSCSKGLNRFAKDHDDINPKYQTAQFNQGDVITTLIKCANGEVVRLSLDTSLPRWYSRGFSIHGTKAFYAEDNHSLWLDSDCPESMSWDWKPHWDNASQYFEKFDHPIWKDFLADEALGGHGGIDFLVYSAFVDAVRNDTPMPIDVYDAAAWMAVTALSEQSIALGSAPVAFPDFTNGRWCERTNESEGKYSL